MGELHGRYHHVSPCVTNLDQAQDFYGGRLGLKEIPGLRQLFVDDPDGNRVEFIGPTTAPRVRRMDPERTLP